MAVAFCQFKDGKLKECSRNEFYQELIWFHKNDSDDIINKQAFSDVKFNCVTGADYGYYWHEIWSRDATHLFFAALGSESILCVRVDSVIDHLEYIISYHNKLLEYFKSLEDIQQRWKR